MYEEQFIIAALEKMFVRGLIGPHPLDASEYLEDSYDSDDMPTLDEFVEDCIRRFRSSYYSKNPKLGVTSTTLGARQPWLALHEAGHAIVGLKLGLWLIGVWFYCNGQKGEAILHNPDETDEPTIRKLIAVDVAGNMAQLLAPGCEPPDGGYLSELCDTKFDIKRCYPSDFLGALSNTDKFMPPITTTTDPDVIENGWRSRKPIFESAETLAMKILNDNSEALGRLADKLTKAPMTGTAVRQLVGELI